MEKNIQTRQELQEISIGDLFTILFKKIHGRVFALSKVLIILTCSFLLTLSMMGSGFHIMNANMEGENSIIEVDNIFLDEVIEYNKEEIPEMDKKLLLISNEALILEEKEEDTFSGSIVEWVSVKFISIGWGTLITGNAESNRELILTTIDELLCNAQANDTGKFGCMFATSQLSEGEINVEYK